MSIEKQQETIPKALASATPAMPLAYSDTLMGGYSIQEKKYILEHIYPQIYRTILEQI